MSLNSLKVLIRGGGEQATAVAHRLHRSHFRVVIVETSNPEAVRREVAFSEAVHEKEKTVEGVTARLIDSADDIFDMWQDNIIPVMVDPEARVKAVLKPDVVVDATIAKRNLGNKMSDARLVIGLGVGFTAGRDVHAVIETKRGHNLGRVIRIGEAEADTGIPGNIMGYTAERVLRAPQAGVFTTSHSIGDIVQVGDVIAEVDGMPIKTVIGGVIRGLLRSGIEVPKGMKSGDVDPRGMKEYCVTISEKGRAIAGGVLEAILAEFNV
ncbi:MAG: selenium-dependent molybdenum cofactor biosynthesis protein YqeB [Dehalococcoidales bacterium]|jgi:xanthine dehydrogenase accessory factor|nr:selenium-dependent molybdenum cofactor biosynthesis protein YqeB [Dehalococcoidales bacterium]MDD3264737.1 selenium-dependent molybdenum cofactor biosynthesis protein YqeB [Dehalococcoidales bacterium]MDD4322340.1 selenium-dependent molybdenum cofactor biosynthesis protein YqeB [Dehalococcoidales bacterium]MDD4794326.1 selenium-dependent molybdenum cofactor biosynthesis protein YqeB [Dehalococcoidales bacterium]MDD5122232.1 selenium-dependent molybdenum cofactor biosynthesis protein YqeB [De